MFDSFFEVTNLISIIKDIEEKFKVSDDFNPNNLYFHDNLLTLVGDDKTIPARSRIAQG